jgi:hypothetical protein
MTRRSMAGLVQQREELELELESKVIGKHRSNGYEREALSG